MNPPKCHDEDYINFLIATPRQVSALEAARVHPEQVHPPAHDAFTRLLHRLEPDSLTLWRDAQTQVNLTHGLLVLDDTTLDKPYAKHMELVTRHWSGKHHAVVRGINLLTLLWSDGDRHVPCDYRVLHKSQDGLSKHDHFHALLAEAKQRGFQPSYVAFDGWYASLANLKYLRTLGWHWLTRLKANRQVNPDRQGLCALEHVAIGAHGRVVWLEGYGLIRVFLIVSPDGDREYWGTDQLAMDEWERLKWASYAWAIEQYHRGIKQYGLIERAQVRSARAWRNHIGLCLRAFLRLESYCYHKGLIWFDAKTAIIRDAVRQYLTHPYYVLLPTA